MSIRKQTVWEPMKDQYSGFVNYGPVPAEEPDKLASEVLVFLLVGTRSHWKCPIGYFLCDKMSATLQAQLVSMALQLAADKGLRVWSVTTDGTSVNMSMFRQLGCKFGTTYESFVTKFKHPSQDYYVYVTLDACHMLKLARNALASLSSFKTADGENIEWSFFANLHKLQEKEGLKLANKLTTQHLKYEKHKMNVKLAAQTLSSSVANAIEFLNVKMRMPQFHKSEATFTFTRTIDQLFDMLNSRNPAATGYRQPLRQTSKSVWESIMKSTAEYLLSLKTNGELSQLLSTHRRKTFIVGFVTTIKSTIDMASEMFGSLDNPFKYLLTYKFSQDHIELLFSCIRSRGGWNNNPNSLQFKYTLRKMLLRNAIQASKNANCIEFDCSNRTLSIIPFFHKNRNNSPLAETDSSTEQDKQLTPEEHLMISQLDNNHSEFISNILFYIGGFIVSRLVKVITCSSCINSLIACSPSVTKWDHDYCSSVARYDEVATASAFTLFVNNGGLSIPSHSVFLVVEYAEAVFKALACVCKAGNEISNGKRLHSKMVMEVVHHFINDKSRKVLFMDHDEATNEPLFEDDHRIKF